MLNKILLLHFRAKIRNIEKTEEAKQKLHQERLNKKDDVSVFVPTNMAVNFVQHNRCEMFLYYIICLLHIYIYVVKYMNI